MATERDDPSPEPFTFDPSTFCPDDEHMSLLDDNPDVLRAVCDAWHEEAISRVLFGTREKMDVDDFYSITLALVAYCAHVSYDFSPFLDAHRESDDYVDYVDSLEHYLDEVQCEGLSVQPARNRVHERLDELILRLEDVERTTVDEHFNRLELRKRRRKAAEQLSRAENVLTVLDIMTDYGALRQPKPRAGLLGSLDREPNCTEQAVIDYLFQHRFVGLSSVRETPQDRRPTGERIARPAVGKDADGHFKGTLARMVGFGWLGNAKKHGLSGGGYFLTDTGAELARNKSGPSRD